MRAQGAITAIDILLEPDATMLRHAQDNNARLLKVFPNGFALDEAHRPHITLLQRFVRTADLDQVYVAAEKVIAGASVTRMQLETFKYYYFPGKDVGVAGIVIRGTPALLALQQELMADRCVHRAARRSHQRRVAHRLRVHLRSEANRRSVQSACQHRRRAPGLPRQNARRTVCTIYLLARGCRCVPARPVRHGCEETQGMEFEALRSGSGRRWDLNSTNLRP